MNATWLTILAAGIQILLVLAKWMQGKQMLSAGEAAAINRSLSAAHENTLKAQEARRKSYDDSDSGGLRDDDGFRRD